MMDLSDYYYNNSEFFNWSDHNCTLISDRVPPEIAVPLYGYLYPMVVLTTVITNTFIVLVLSQPQLRTATNRILLAMAVTESLTGLAGSPFFIYYYTFEGYKEDELNGMPYFWCKTQQLFSESLPTIFHTSAIWLTVYLAVHRYFFVRKPQAQTNMPHQDSPKTKLVIIAVVVCAALLEMPRALSRNLIHKEDPNSPNKLICCYVFAKWTTYVGPNVVFMTQYWSMALLVHGGPCAVLVVFGVLLIRTVSDAARRRRQSLVSLNQARCHGLHATTKMLLVVLLLFLATEIPAAVIFIMHVCLVSLKKKWDYHPLNVALIVRNIFILVSFPFNFAIYLSMSAQFRAAVKNLFYRKTLGNEAETTNLLHLETRKPTTYETRVITTNECPDGMPMVLLYGHHSPKVMPDYDS